MVWWADLPRPAGHRPVLLLTRDGAYSYLNRIVVAEITTTIRAIPTEVALGRRDGLPGPCVANCDNIRGVRRDRLAKRICLLPPDRHSDVKRALGYALGWPELMDL